MKAPRVGFILYCIPNAACRENWNGFIFNNGMDDRLDELRPEPRREADEQKGIRQ